MDGGKDIHKQVYGKQPSPKVSQALRIVCGIYIKQAKVSV